MKRRTHRRLISFVLAMTMLAETAPATALATAAVSERAVTSLAKLYDGDEARARKMLDALYDAGLIDENGSMIELDVRADGEQVSLDELSRRIAGGEEPADITVNGHAADAERIMQLAEVKSTLQIVQMLGEDVEITDEHIANLEALIQGIADGSIDIAAAAKEGELTLTGKRAAARATLQSASSDFPTTKISEGTVSTNKNGEYQDRYISGSEYEQSYYFKLSDPENMTFYTDSTTTGYKNYPTVQIQRSSGTVAPGNTVTFKATKGYGAGVPASVDYLVSAPSGTIASGTVSFTADETTKTFDVAIPADSALWNGSEPLLLQVGNRRGVSTLDRSDTQIIQMQKSDLESICDEIGWKTYDATKKSRSGGVTSSIGSWYQTYNEVWEISNLPKAITYKLSTALYVDAKDRTWSRSLKAGIYGSNEETQTANITYYSKPSGYNYFDKAGTTKTYNESKIVTFSKADLETKTSSGKTNIPFEIMWYSDSKNSSESISSAKIEVPNATANYTISNVSVPLGTYYGGQTVPINVTFSTYVVADSGTTLKVNDTDVAPLNPDGTVTKTLTFGYQLDKVCPAKVNVTGISGVINTQYTAMTLQGSFPQKSFGKTNGVTVVADSKLDSIDFSYENAKWGISDDESGKQVVTVVLPFKEGADLTWIGNESESCTVNGRPLSLPIPGYADGTANYYLRGAYFSYDKGATRFPIYVVNSGGKQGVALAARFTPKRNDTAYLRYDALNLFFDPTIGFDSATTYLDTWANAQVAETGWRYFDGTGKADAPYNAYRYYQYYVKGGTFFTQDQFISRGDADYSARTADGWLNLDDNSHVFLADPENPGNRYDVEIIANDSAHKAFVEGIHAEDISDMTLTYQFSSRKNFTFSDPSQFTWATSNSEVVRLEQDADGTAHLLLTGTEGTSEITLTVGNGVASKAFTLSLGTLTVFEGKTPFLNISKYSQQRYTLINMDTDVLFASNVTARNGQLGKDTTFSVKLYRAEETADGYAKTGDAIWSGSFLSTIENPRAHVTIPASQLTEAGVYAAEVSTVYLGGELLGKESKPNENLTASAFIIAELPPVKVMFDNLDSYFCTPTTVPELSFTCSRSDADTWVQISRNGAEFDGTINGNSVSFNPPKPNGIKDIYFINIYAAEPDDHMRYSMDSMLLTVYNPDVLKLIVKDVVNGEIGGTTEGTGDSANGTTLTLDNHGKLAGYGVTGSEYQLTFDDFTALRTDMSLQKIASLNYGEESYAMLDDKMAWESSDSDVVSVNYAQGGIYSDVRNYSYTSYMPASDMLIVGKDETEAGKPVTITATHANTGMKASFNVVTKTLKDQLYVFSFIPAAETQVLYTNGKGVKRQLTSNANGELAVYEPDGIDSNVVTLSQYEDKTYVGTLFPSDIQTGERDIAALQLYPCNNLRLRAISDAELTFVKPDGSKYSGQVTLRGGVYKNGEYCPDAIIRVGSTGQPMNGRNDITATVTDGKLDLCMDPTQFKIDPDSPDEIGGAQVGDKITYVFEYRFANSYRPGYVVLHATTNSYGESSPTDSLVQMLPTTGGDKSAQIIKQSIQQYLDNEPVSYSRDVIRFTERVGVSKRVTKVELTTDVALPDGKITTDKKGYATFSMSGAGFVITNANGYAFTGQTRNKLTAAECLTDLSALDDTTFYVFPFSSMPILRSVYTMTDANLKADGITDEGSSAKISASAKLITTNGKSTKTDTLPFEVANLSHQKDLSAKDGGAEELGVEINAELSSQLDLGSIFGDIDAGEMLQKGFVFLSALTGGAGETPMSMMILPTEDPGKFRIVVSIGYNKRDMKTDSNPSVDFDPDHLYDDMESFQKELEELGKDDKKDDKKNDDADAGEVKVSFNFYGTVILEAKIGVLGEKWGIDFCGGTVGANFSVKYEYGQNFMCGPVPVTISFEIGATADLEVGFANKAEARALLIDAAIGISMKAFAGVGFDAGLFALKVGISGEVAATDNFLYLTVGNQTGNKLDITGQIGLKFVAKAAIISYENEFASVGFHWSKTWGKYSQIREQWENEGYADLSGTTSGGRAFKMRLLPNGTASIEIEGSGEIENRDYLANGESLWNAPKRALRSASGGMTTLQSNAYPFSNPVLSDDGNILLYISDNGNADELESVVCYAVKSGSGYAEKGRIDTSEDNILTDLDAAVSGSGSNTFAAWIKQMDSPEKEMHHKVSYDDLGMMLNATELYVGRYDGSKWSTERLTDNTVADMAPTIASSGDRAIVAWRALSAAEMPAEGGTDDLTAMFNAKNVINYRMFDGTTWNDAQIAYNGTLGTVDAIDTAMLPDGTAMLVYTVRTTDDITGTETFYAVIDKDGEIVTNGCLTNDSYTDNHAQVTAVGDSFIAGWYSEHAAEEAGVSDETVVSRDIRLARISADGALDPAFPQSIGGGSDSMIGSDFRFSAPANCEDLNDLAIVWPQKKDSDSADDAGKYQLNAVRFYEANGITGVTAETTVAETAKYFTIDSYDTYTDENGTVHAALLGSDYSGIDGIEVYDTIDFSDLPVYAVGSDGSSSTMLEILSQDPEAKMMLASGSFAETAVAAKADFNLSEVMPEFALPVQFTVTNTGTAPLTSVQVQMGTQTQTFTGLNILPAQSAVLTADYAVPTAVRDVAYTVTANNAAESAGTLVLNLPDVGISSMKVTRESEKTRDIQLILSNASEIPLAGSGKTVKLAFYTDSAHTKQLGDTITIPASAYTDIDGDIFVYNRTVNVEDLIGGAAEVPESGVRVYAEAWVDDIDELYTMNNSSFTKIGGLLDKYGSNVTLDSALLEENGSYSVSAEIRNNSLQSADLGDLVADVFDSEGNVLTTVALASALTLTGEQVRTLTAAVPETAGTPASAAIRSTEKTVVLNASLGGGTCDVHTIGLTPDNTLASELPDAVREGYTFDGWFTEPRGGEQVTADTVFDSGATIYAHFTYIKADQTFTVSMNDYTYDGKAHTPKLTGTVYGTLTTTYYDAATGIELAAAPTDPGWYRVRVAASGNTLYNEAERTAEYHINLTAAQQALADSVTLTQNAPVPVYDGQNHVKASYSAEAAEGTEIIAYGMLYSNNGAFAAGTALTLCAVNGTDVMQSANLDTAAIPDSGSGVIAVGYVTVKNADGVTVTVYTGDLGGNYAPLVEEKFAAGLTVTEYAPAPLNNGRNRVKVRFAAEAADGFTITDSGLLYSNNGTVTDAAELTLDAADGTNIKQGAGWYSAKILDSGSGVIAVGYVTAADENGNSFTRYTGNLGGDYTSLVDEAFAAGLTLTEHAPAAINDGRSRVKVGFAAEAADGYTITAYGLLYSNNGTVTDAAALTLDAADGTNIKQGADWYSAKILDYGSGVIAVGYVTAADENGNSVTRYTGDLGGNYASLLRAEHVMLKANAPEPTNNGRNRVKVSFSADVADSCTVTAYGLLYSNNGTVTDAAELTLDAADGINIKQGTDWYSAKILDSGSGVVAVGYVTVTDENGNSFTRYTGDLGGNYASLIEEKFADALTLTENAPTAINDGRNRVKVRFAANAADGFTVTAYGLLYSNNGTVTDAAALTLDAVDGTNIKQGTDWYSAKILDYGTGVIAVGYVTLADENGNFVTRYTGDLGGNYASLIEEKFADALTLTEIAPTAINDGRDRVKVRFAADAADGFTVTAYGLLYSNNGTITDAAELTLDAVDGTNIKQGTDWYSAKVLDHGTGVIAVGYVTLADENGNFVTRYTGDLGGIYAELAQ